MVETCKMMKNIITRLATKHKFDLTVASGEFTLNNGSYMPLTIRKVRPQVIDVFHINGAFQYDPMMRFFMDSLGWVPIMIQQLPLSIGGRKYSGVRVSATLNDDDTAIEMVNNKAMKEIAEFGRFWSKNLTMQLWAARGILDETSAARVK